MVKRKNLTDYHDWERVIKLSALGYSQHYIANIIGIKRQTVQRILKKAEINGSAKHKENFQPIYIVKKESIFQKILKLIGVK